jgi:hypothetical protein
MPLHNLERNAQKRESKMICNESTKCCYTWESSTICLGMFLGLPHLQMAGWGLFIASPTLVAVGHKATTFCRRAHWTVWCAIGQYTVHCPVPAMSVDCWIRPLPPFGHLAHRTVWGRTGQSGVTWWPLAWLTCRRWLHSRPSGCHPNHQNPQESFQY